MGKNIMNQISDKELISKGTQFNSKKTNNVIFKMNKETA
jgi:hypothetical protein